MKFLKFLKVAKIKDVESDRLSLRAQRTGWQGRVLGQHNEMKKFANQTHKNDAYT